MNFEWHDLTEELKKEQQDKDRVDALRYNLNFGGRKQSKYYEDVQIFCVVDGCYNKAILHFTKSEIPERHPDNW